MSGRNLRAIGGRTSRIRIRGRARGRIIRGVRGIRSFRSSRIRQRGDFGMVTLPSNEGSEFDYAMLKDESYKMKHYSDRYSHESMHYYRSRSRSRSRSLSRTRSRSRSRSMSRSPYRRFSHHRHYSRSRSRSYSPPRHRSRSISRSLSRSPPRRHRLSPRRPERCSTERTGPPKRLQEENRKREMRERFQSRPVERYAKQPVKKEQVKVVKEQVKAVKEQVKAAREQVKIVKEQYKKMIPLPEVTRKETPPPPVKEPVELPVTIRDMPIYSEDESDNDLDPRLLTPQTKKEERFKFETDISKDIRSQLLERAMIEKKKLGLENPGAAEKSSALEALQCYSPETHSPSPSSQSNYESHNIQVKKNTKKRKALAKKDPLKSIFQSSEDSGNKTECLPSIPGLGFSSIEDEEKFLYGDDEEKDNGEKCGSGDDDDVDDDDDDYDDGINMGGGSNIIQHEVKPKIKVEPIARSVIKGSVVESNDWSNSNVNIPLQEAAPKRRRLLTSGPDDNTIDYTRSEITPKSYASSTVHHEIIERKYSGPGMIDIQLSEKLGQNVKDSPSQFSKSSLSPPIMKLAEKGSKLEFTSQFEAKPSHVTRRKDSLEERHSKQQSPSSDFERASNKSEKYFHSALLGRRSKREESPPRKEHIPRYKSRPELYEEISERKHRERSRKAENLRTDERARDWEDSPRHRTPDRSPWRSPEERKKWDSYREYSRSPRNLSLERSSCHSGSPREPYCDRSPSHSPRRWSSPRREENSSRWSPRREMSPGEDDGPNAKSRDWPETSHRDHYYDRWHSPSRSPDERRSRSPSWNKEYENSYQQKATQSFDTASAEAYTTSQQSSNINVETTDTTSYQVPQPTYYQPVYPSVNPHLPYSDYNTTQFPQTASYTAPFQPTPMPYMNLPPSGYPPAVIQIQPQRPPTRAQENIVRTNLTVIPLQSETQKPKETKHVFSKSEDERKKSETSKCTFVTISDSNQGEYSQVSADYSSLSYRQLLDKRTEKKKHLFLLRSEMAKLCKMQGEMMRKKQKEKDGHKDALIVENTKLQEEVSNQIQENKQELLQIKQAIRNFITEAGKQDVEKKQDKQQKKYEQERREQESEQNQKNRSEEKEDVSDDLLDNETNFSFKYFDPGNHWCKLCNEVNASIYKLFEHLHSSKHRQKMDPCDRPWAPQKKWSEKSVSGQTIAAPIKGVQFLVPLESFYCSICKEILPDGSSAEEHLKSTSHNRNYTKYILLNPFYERRWNLDKAAGIAVAEKEEKKRQRELLIEARNKKREEAERQRKELIKNEKAKEVKKLHDIPVTKPLVEKDDKSKPKAIRLTLLSDKGKLTKQKKDEKMLSPKETKPVPVIYIGKAPNFRSMAHKQDTSGFGKFNWKKDENEIVPEDQTSIPEDFKPNQDDEKPKVEETEQIKDKTKHFPLRKSKKPQLNIVYGPEPPPDLHLLQTSVTPEKTDDGMLPSEIDIAQAFAGKFEGSEESATNSKKQGVVESTVTNKSSNTSSAKFLIIDETPSEPEFFQEETRPASSMPTGPSRQMMLMLRSVENMSKEAQYNVVTPKVTDNKYKQFVTTENSQLANKPTVAVAGSVSRIVPTLKPPGEEDIFFTENANIKPPPPLLPKINQSENKPRISTMRNETSSAESAKDSINKPSTLPENVSKPTKIVVGNISKPATIMGNVNKSSMPLMASTNKPTTTVTGSVNRSTMAVTNVNKCAVLGDTVNKTSVAVANKPPLVEGESAKKIISITAENVNKLAVASEIVKYPAVTVVENENRSFSVTMGNIARIQPQQITNIKSEEQKITKTIDRIIPDAIPVLQVGSSYQGGIETTGNATHVGTMTRPTKVQIIFPTVKTAEKSLPDAVPIIELKENLIESELVAKPMANSLKPQAECIANAVQSKGQLNLIDVEVARQTIPDEICESILEKDQSNELEGKQSESESKVVLQPDETASKIQQDLSVAINDVPAVLSDETREETTSLVSPEEEKKEESENVKQNLNQVHDSILIQEQHTQKCSLIESAEAVSICRSNEVDCLVTSIKSDLEKEDDVKCKTTKDDNTIETSEETMKVTSICDDTIEADVKDELITALSSEESSTQLSTSAGNRIVQVEDSSFDKVFETTNNAVCDSETLSTSNVLETRIPPGTHNETMHEEKETNMDTDSECNLKLSTCEVTDAPKTNDVESNVIDVYPECKAKQVDDQVSYIEAVMKVEHETLDNDGTLNSVEDVAVSSTASEMPIQKNKCFQEIDSETAVTSCSETGTHSDIAVESVVSLCSTNNDIPVTNKSINLEITNTELPPKSKQEEADVNMEVESDTGLHSYSKAQCIAVNSTPKAEFAENTSDVSLKQEIINHSSHSVEEMDTSDNVEPSNMCFDDANVSNVTEEAESMDVDPGNNSLHSDDTVQCIIECSEATVTECKPADKLDILQSLHGQEEKMDTDSGNFCFDSKTLDREEEVKNKSEQQRAAELLNNKSAEADIGTEKESKLSIDSEANVTESKMEKAPSNTALKKEELKDDKSILSSSEDKMNTTECTGLNAQISKELVESSEQTTERKIDSAVKTEGVTSATESIVMKDEIKEISSNSKNEQPNKVAPSSKTEAKSSCDQLDTGYSCDEEALNLNEDTVEFYESQSPKEHIPDNNGQVGIGSLSNLITFPKTETMQSGILESDREKNTQASHDNVSSVTSTKIEDGVGLVKDVGQEIHSSTKIVSILDSTPESKQIEVDTEIKVTSSPQEETVEEIEEAGLVIPVGLSPTQQTEDKSDVHFQAVESRDESVQHTFGIDDADATIQALENLLEETKQLQSPVAKASVSKETTIEAEENAVADSEQKSD